MQRTMGEDCHLTSDLMLQHHGPLPSSDMLDSIVFLCGEVRCEMRRYAIFAVIA